MRLITRIAFTLAIALTTTATASATTTANARAKTNAKSPDVATDSLPDITLDPPEHDDIKTPPPAKKKTSFVGWSALVPAFVIHGLEPGGEAAEAMPRKLTTDGRFVATPGLGVEYKAQNSFNFLIGFLKDCYDDPAGSIQVGQHWQVGQRFDWGYTVGLYIRQTPITCYSTTTTSSSNFLPGPPGGQTGRNGNRTAPPANVNSFSSETCIFSDNLPVRYTFQGMGTYIDIIPSPFVNASFNLYRGPINVDLKLMSNFFLNEFGLSISL